MERKQFLVNPSHDVSLSLVNKKLVLFLLGHDEIFSRNDSEQVLTLGLLEANDLIPLSCLGFEKWDGNACDLLVGLVLEDQELVNIRHDDHVHGGELYGMAAREVLRVHAHSQVVHVLSLVNVKALLVHFESNAVALPLTDHHLTARHKVVHHVL